MDPASRTSPRSALNSEDQPNRGLASHACALRDQNIHLEHPSGHDDAPRQSKALASGAEDQARVLNTGCEHGQAPQPIGIHARSMEPPSENGKENGNKTLEDVRYQDFSENGSRKTSLAEKTLVPSLDIPFVPNRPPRENTASLKSYDVGLDTLIRRCTETPSWRITKSRCENAVHSSAKNREPQVQPARCDTTPISKIQDSFGLTANQASAIGTSFAPSTPIIQPPQIPFDQTGISSRPSSSMAWLDQSQRPYDYGAHRVPVSEVPISRACGMRRSEMPARNAWHGYDNLYERQEMHRYNFPSGSVWNMRGYTPVGTPSSEEFKAPEGYLKRPYHGLDLYRRRGKVGVQQPKEHHSGSSNFLNGYSENLQGATHRNFNSPIPELVADVGNEESGHQICEESSHDERFDVSGEVGVDLGQRCPPQYCFNAFGQPTDLARQDHSSFEPYVEDYPAPWNEASPSHTAQSRHGLIDNSNRARLDQDEEGHFAGFWKPNLLY